MAKDEVELGGKDAGEDYEVVPVGPIRKLERRIDDMEEKPRKEVWAEEETMNLSGTFLTS